MPRQLQDLIITIYQDDGKFDAEIKRGSRGGKVIKEKKGFIFQQNAVDWANGECAKIDGPEIPKDSKTTVFYIDL